MLYENINIPYKSQNKEQNNSAGYFVFNKDVLRKYLYIKEMKKYIKQDRLCTSKRNAEARSRNHRCRGKAK